RLVGTQPANVQWDVSRAGPGIGPRTMTPRRPGDGGRGVTSSRVGSVSPGASSRVATLERATLVLGQTAPHAGVLAALERPAQAGFTDVAATADRFGLLDLEQRGAGVPDGEEQLRVLVATGG